MSFFNNIKLFWKFTIFGGLASALLVVTMLVSYSGMKGTERRFERYSGTFQALALTVSEMHTQGIQSEQAIRNVIFNPSDEKALANYKKANADVLELHKQSMELAASLPEYTSKLKNIPTLWQENGSIKDQIIELAKAGDQPAAVAMLNKEETPRWRVIKGQIIAIQKQLKTDMQAEQKALNNFSERTFAMTTTALVLTVVLVNLLLLVFWKIMQRSLGEMVHRLQDIAAGEGDLTQRLVVRGKDEFAEAAHWLNEFIEKLNRTLSSVNGTTSTLASATYQLNNTAEQMATSSEEVAVQASTVATASEEMAATSNDIAQNCHAAAESAQEAATTTQKGFEVVTRTINGIRERGERTRENAQAIASLGERSDQIGAIVSTIEDIADQTNLLALNAAIEAARAGEMGRGFAVVADEVRALAERTTRATKEISDMIRTIQQETRTAIISMEEGVRGTEKGAAEAAQLESALQAILEQVNAVTMQVSQIATAAEEQTATTSEITSNIHKISEVIEGTAKGAQDTSSAATSLSRLGEELKRLMGQFKLA
jgi:methyl-accepting chemotaxis protein